MGNAATSDILGLWFFAINVGPLAGLKRIENSTSAPRCGVVMGGGESREIVFTEKVESYK